MPVAVFPPDPLNVHLAATMADRALTLAEFALARVSPLYQNGTYWQGSVGSATSFPVAQCLATLARYTPNVELKREYVTACIAVVENQIEVNLLHDGQSWTDFAADPFGWGGQFPDAQAMATPFSPSDIITMISIEALGWILWQLPVDLIPSDMRLRWVKVCQDACYRLDHWYDGGSITTYYINANFQCSLLNCYWFTAIASHGTKRLYYEDCYERAYRFMVQPAVETAPFHTWDGWGLTTTVSPNESDWSDGEGYLTETNDRDPLHNPSFDWEYSQAQMNRMCQTYTNNRDPRLGRLINLISNKVYPRIAQVDNGPTSGALSGTLLAWTLDASNGSRQNGPRDMDGCWPYVQALIMGKRQNRTLLSEAQMTSMWDTGNGMVKSVLNEGTPSIGSYPLIADLNNVAIVLEASKQVLNATLATS